jgi:hypothetical protein
MKADPKEKVIRPGETPEAGYEKTVKERVAILTIFRFCVKSGEVHMDCLFFPPVFRDRPGALPSMGDFFILKDLSRRAE